MLTHDGKIKLTTREQEAFRTFTEFSGPVPESVSGYNRAIAMAADEARDGTPEGRLLAAIVESIKAPE